MSADDFRGAGRRHQRGAVAIEFAVLFLVFFALVYAIIGYSLPFLLTLSFKQLSAEAARSAVRVSPAPQAAAYIARVNRQVHEVVEASWLPSGWVQGGCPAPEEDAGWIALPDMAGRSLGHYRLMPDAPSHAPRYQLNVCLQRAYDREQAIIPTLTLFGVDVPTLPQDARGESVVRGRSSVRL